MNSIARIGKLLRIELEVKGKLILIICATAAALTLYLKFGGSDTNPFSNNSDPLSFIKPRGTRQKFHFDWFPTFLYGLGLAITSLMFYEYKGGKSRNYHLTIPASKSEKWWCKIIAYVVISNLIVLLSYQILSIGINRMEANNGYIFSELGILDPYLWKTFKGYLFVQALFIAGASFTQRFTFIKVGAFLFIIKYACKWITETTMSFIVTETNSSPFSTFNLSGISSILGKAGLTFNGPESILTLFSPPTGVNWFIVLALSILLYGWSYLRFSELES